MRKTTKTVIDIDSSFESSIQLLCELETATLTLNYSALLAM